MKMKNYFLDNKKVFKKRTILKGDYRSLFKRYKNGAKKRELSFELDEDSFLHLVTSNCHFCGVPPFQNHNKIKYMGIDRIKNDQGYLKSNCSPCCKRCNYAKGTMSLPEFDGWLEQIAEFYPKLMKSYGNNTYKQLHGDSNYQKALNLLERRL